MYRDYQQGLNTLSDYEVTAEKVRMANTAQSGFDKRKKTFGVRLGSVDRTIDYGTNRNSLINQSVDSFKTAPKSDRYP